jgi:hypothetical protein
MDILVVALGAAFLLLLFWGLGVVARHYRHNDQPIRFSRMVEKLGLSVRRIGNSGLATHLPTAARLCMKCPSKKECDAWLAGEAGCIEPPEFCLNRSFLRMARHAGDTPY